MKAADLPFTVLLELRGGTFGVLHVLLDGRCVRNFTGQLATLRETILPQYVGCEMRWSGPLGFRSAGQAWAKAEPILPEPEIAAS